MMDKGGTMQRERLIWMLGWAVAQGISLLLLHQWILWLAKPGSYFFLIWPLYVIAVALPMTMQMLAEYRREQKLWLLATIAVFAMVACAAYLGRISWYEGIPDYYMSGEYFKFGLMASVCWFVLLPFIEHRLHYGSWFADYGFLFWTACSNNVRLLSAGIFTGVFWALLGLWAGLFKVLKIDIFADLFSHRGFVYPVGCTAVGIGLSLYRSRQELLLNHYRNFLNLVAWLLPLVAGIMLLFLAALPFKGLASLWDTGYATALMLALLALMIVLFNAAWQDAGGEQKFSPWLTRLIETALLSMPIYIALSGYALSLRISQYGWTRDRVWAVLLVALLGIFAGGYAFVVLRRGSQWMSAVRFVNIAGALALSSLLLLTASPVFDPARIAVHSQVNRLLSSKKPLPDFDYHYLRFEGGRYGNTALKSLSKLKDHSQAESIRRNADAALKAEWRYYNSLPVVAVTREELMKRLKVYPKGAPIDASFYDDLLLDFGNTADYRAYRYCLQNRQQCYLLSADLNADGRNELVVMDGNGAQNGVFVLKDGHWQYVGFLRSEPPYRGSPEIKKILESGDFETLAPAWRLLRLGQNRYTLEATQ